VKRKTLFHSASYIQDEKSERDNSAKNTLIKIVETHVFDEDEEEVHVKRVATV